MTPGFADENLLRALAPQVLGALLRRYGASQFDLCEDAVQDALLAAYEQWPRRGNPDDPLAWLITTAQRRLIDHIRSEKRRRDRELTHARLSPAGIAQLRERPGSQAGAEVEAEARVGATDDSVQLLRLCCHPSLSPAAQVALTLRAVAGLTTAQIARAYLLPEATVAQRITRAKARIRDAGAVFPSPTDAEDRITSVLTVLYLMFNEGHTATAGPAVHDVELSGEAIRLARMVCSESPERLSDRLSEHGEAAGLLALMLLTDARRPARTTPDGALVPLDEQDRSLWNQAAIDEGVAILERTLLGRRPSAYLLQASIAALHDEAPSTDETDWPQILILYKLLERETGNPVVTLNRAVAEAMVHGPTAGLAIVDRLLVDPVKAKRLAAEPHRVLAVRAHLLEQAGEREAAIDAYRSAARATASIPERDYLLARARRMT
ncbi:RNA polymerase sigma factor [Rathayibacter soli]|uniref:RNA polymerase sigma factor n=1 Tax=Rathayibacter soli TaxID=3144168 RepID=UPI0027E3D7AE|nr:sigma-70 family RNA polymerase sigma factor [Glaciibacter superstes]